MCLALKLDNGKVVSIAHEKTHTQTDGHTHRTTQYRISIIDVDIYLEPKFEYTRKIYYLMIT